MTVLLRDGNRRCDAVCHEARGEHCTCICGGKNHGSTRSGPLPIRARRPRRRDRNQLGLFREEEAPMGFCITIPDAVFGVEVRGESVCLHDPTDEGGATHIFASHNGHVELSKALLRELLAWFDDPENRRRCDVTTA